MDVAVVMAAAEMTVVSTASTGSVLTATTAVGAITAKVDVEVTAVTNVVFIGPVILNIYLNGYR